MKQMKEKIENKIHNNIKNYLINLLLVSNFTWLNLHSEINGVNLRT